MKFEITKASWWYESGVEAPCEKAYLEDNKWYVEVENLNDLLIIINEVEEIILNKNRIVVYDNYVE